MARRNPCAACGAPWLQNRTACWACGASMDWRPSPAPPMVPAIAPRGPIGPLPARQVVAPATYPGTVPGLRAPTRPCLRCGHDAPLLFNHCPSCGAAMQIADPLRQHPLPRDWGLEQLPDGTQRIKTPRAVAPLAAAGVLVFLLIRYGFLIAQLVHLGSAPHHTTAPMNAHYAPYFWGLRATEALITGLIMSHLIMPGLFITFLVGWMGLGRVEWRVEGPALLTIRRWYFGLRRTQVLRPAAVVVSPRQQPVTRRHGWAVQVVADGVLHPIHWQALRSEGLFYTGAYLSQQLGIPMEDHGSCDV